MSASFCKKLTRSYDLVLLTQSYWGHLSCFQLFSHGCCFSEYPCAFIFLLLSNDTLGWISKSEVHVYTYCQAALNKDHTHLYSTGIPNLWNFVLLTVWRYGSFSIFANLMVKIASFLAFSLLLAIWIYYFTLFHQHFISVWD